MRKLLLALTILLASFVYLTTPLLTHVSASSPPTVAYVGDSTMVGEEPYLPPNSRVYAMGGIDIATAYSMYGPALQANPPDIVVIALGLNDAEGASLGFLFEVAQFAWMFPPTTKIIWLDTVTAPACSAWMPVEPCVSFPSYYPDVEYGKSSLIDVIAQHTPNMVALSLHPPTDQFTPGGVHYTPAGYQAREAAFEAEVNKAGT